MKSLSSFLIKALSILTILMVFLPVATQAVVTPESPREGLEQIGEVGIVREQTLPEFVGTIIKWVVGLIGVLLVALFVYGGVVYATSAGNEERIELGKKIMMYSIVGVAIIAFAFLITDYVISALFPET
jgi:uncharacterized membrane protein